MAKRKPSASFDGILKDHRDEILQIAGRHGVLQMKVFGSMSRGDVRPESDVDLLVLREPGRSLLDLIALKHELEDLLGRNVDLVTTASLSPYIREQVLAEAIDL